MRVKSSAASKRKHKKVFGITKGYWGRKKNVFRRAKEAFLKSLSRMFHDRKLKKRDFRKLWIMRINAAARENGMSYSVFMNGLKKANITINRKMLADIAVNDAPAFATLVAKAREALAA